MKKIFIIAAFLPLFCFGLGVPDDQYYRFWIYQYSTSGTVTSSTSSPYLPLDQIFNYIFSNQSGIRITSLGNLNQPEISLTNLNIWTNSSRNISFALEGYDDHCYYSTLKSVPNLNSLYSLIGRLYVSGAPTSAFSSIYTNSSNQISFNVRPNRVIADCLVSTNTVFRSEILRFFNSIDQSLNSIDSNVISILSLLSNSTSVSNSYTDVLAFANNIYAQASQNGFNLDINKIHDQLNPDSYDLSTPENRAAFQSIVDSYSSGLKQLSSLIGLASSIDSVDERDNGLKNLGDALHSGLNNSVNSLGGSAASLNTNLTNYTRLSTNWQESVKKDLQDWRNDVTNRLSHMFDDGVGVKGGNNTSPVVVSGAYGGPVGVAGTVHAVIDNLTLGVQIDKPVEIDHTQLNQISAGYDSIVDAVQNFHDSFTDFTTSGNKPFNWIAYYNMFYEYSNSVQSNQVDQISLLSSLTNLMFNYTQNFTNDLIFSISNALVGLSAVSNDYMLLTDYANYINSSGLSDLIDIMDDDTYSDLKDELLGISSLDQSDSYGRWWRYFTGLVTVSANSSLRISNLLSGHEKTINELAQEPGAKSLLDHFSDLLESIPSQTDIDDKSNQLTNSIDSSGFSALLVDIDTMSNSFNNVSRFFDRGSTLPQSITFDLGLGMPSASSNPNPIVLPLSKYRGIMDLLHYGIAFSYCVVNLILLPKFILLLIHLFDKVWRGYDKKLAHSTTV